MTQNEEKALYFVNMPSFSQSQSNLSQTTVHYLKLEKKRVQRDKEAKKHHQNPEEDAWTKKARNEMLSMDGDQLYKWTQEALLQSPFLLNTGMPIKFIKNRLQKEERIRSGKDLFVTNVRLVECAWCNFRNPMDRVLRTESCMICHREFGILVVTTEAYKLDAPVEYDKWSCRCGHINESNAWYCKASNCGLSMRSRGSKSCKK